ncbi:Hypothetical protein SMAX5B_018695 [Scophthalmus maximus]|uniref:Uncharacterized protein n=1 Tax=Scophthalmus maximus TaxID=52904 RepID=A0A2U9CD70_SCOMX|nr:Hypothetical protein SMAX5B_018695 [Scophthalmus maximus]KAF0026103.1 hypothetical protein F2P81_020840 [Scophthalmus maximus]
MLRSTERPPGASSTGLIKETGCANGCLALRPQERTHRRQLKPERSGAGGPLPVEPSLWGLFMGFMLRRSCREYQQRIRFDLDSLLEVD